MTPIKLTSKDAQITASGLLQAIINSGADPEQWLERSLYALRIHRHLTRRLLGEHTAPPIFKEMDNG